MNVKKMNVKQKNAKTKNDNKKNVRKEKVTKMNVRNKWNTKKKPRKEEKVERRCREQEQDKTGKAVFHSNPDPSQGNNVSPNLWSLPRHMKGKISKQISYGFLNPLSLSQQSITITTSLLLFYTVKFEGVCLTTLS